MSDPASLRRARSSAPGQHPVLERRSVPERAAHSVRRKVLNRRRGVKKCEADLIFDLSLLPTRRRRAGYRLDEMVRAHLKEAAIAPERRTLRTVLRDIFRSRAISLIDLPFCKCSRLIRPIVSTTSIPHRPLDAKAGRPANSLQGGQICTPIPRIRGSNLHAETQARVQFPRFWAFGSRGAFVTRASL